MKKTINIHLLTILLSLIAITGFGQNDTIPEVVKSSNKVKIGGEKYYVHEVKKGQTLYSISNAYNVSQKIIARENPNVFLGLQPGQSLKIPFKETHETDFTKKDTSRFFFHKIKKGQTLYSLSKRYNTTPDTIKKYNPILSEEDLKINQTIKIPKKTAGQDIQKTKTDTSKELAADQRKGEYISHRVKPEETLYSLSQKYNVEVEDILNANKDIEQDNLQKDQVIRIPKLKDTTQKQYITEIKAKEPSSKDTTFARYTDINKTIFECDSSNFSKKEEMNVSIFLPFYLEKNFEKYYIDSSEVKRDDDDEDDEDGEKEYKKVKRSPDYIYSSSENFIEFYEGILLALDTLKSSGMSINLKLFDTKNDTNHVRKKLENNDLSNEDLIIGPVYDDNFQLVSEYAGKHNIDIVSPFPKEKETLKNNPNHIQIYPTWDTQLERFASYISRFNDKNMMLIHSGDSLYYPEIGRFKEKIFNYISQDTSLSDVRFKEVAYKDSLLYLKQALNKGEENIVIVPSEKEAFVTDVITNLNTLSKRDYDIRVFGYSEWKNFVNLNPEYFYNLRVNLFSPFHIDYKKPIVKKTVKNYRKLFKTEPTKYVFHGFDIGYYFFNALHKYGDNFQNCLHNYTPELNQTNFLFYKEKPSLGIENISIYILKYNTDYTIEDFKLSLRGPVIPKEKKEISDLD
ncbi:MAG: PBP1 and LysM peptidoglycan-binding domain-containing protein [Bacteroidota bacterium]